MNDKERRIIIEDFVDNYLAPQVQQLELNSNRLKDDPDKFVEFIRNLTDELFEKFLAINGVDKFNDLDEELRNVSAGLIVLLFNQVLPIDYPFVLALLEIMSVPETRVVVICRDILPGLHEMTSTAIVPRCRAESDEAADNDDFEVIQVHYPPTGDEFVDDDIDDENKES